MGFSLSLFVCVFVFGFGCLSVRYIYLYIHRDRKENGARPLFECEATPWCGEGNGSISAGRAIDRSIYLFKKKKKTVVRWWYIAQLLIGLEC